MGPKLEMAKKWPAAISRGGPQNGRKMAGQMAGQPENGQISAIQPFICPAIFRPSPKNGRRPFRQPFFWPFPVSGPFPTYSWSSGRKGGLADVGQKGEKDLHTAVFFEQ